MTKEEILEVLKKSFQDLEADGHTIMDPQFFIELGFDKEFVDTITDRIESGDDYKSTIFDNDGNPVEYMDGVHYLNFWSHLCKLVSPDFYTDKMGRGFRARAFYTEVEKVLKHEMDVEAAS
jgi:NurA-like 5'-3' nuclease